MDRAIHEETKKIVTALTIGHDASYQNLKKDIWHAPEDSISNWDELKELNIEKVRVHWVTEKEYKNFRGTLVSCAPYFAVYPNSSAKTIPESPEHKMLKNFIHNAIKNKDITLIISKQRRNKLYLTKVSIKDLDDIINWNKYNIEVTSNGYKKLRADILLPFYRKHELLGYGIDFEIQLGKQSERITRDRSVNWALSGFSVVWLNEDDFYFNENKTEIELKKKELKVKPYAHELYYSGKVFCRQLKNTVVDQSRLLDNKIDETKTILNNQVIEASNKLDTKINRTEEATTIFTEQSNQTYREIEQRINNFFERKMREVENGFKKEVKDKIYSEMNEQLKDFEFYKDFVSSPPTCPKCGAYLRLNRRRNDGDLFIGCSGYPECSYTQAASPILIKFLRGNNYEN